MLSDMKSNKFGKTARGSVREERGDASTKILHRTIVVCAVALVGVLLFAFSPRKKDAATNPAATRAEAKASVASFDRQSLSTKDR